MAAYRELFARCFYVCSNNNADTCASRPQKSRSRERRRHVSRLNDRPHDGDCKTPHLHNYNSALFLLAEKVRERDFCSIVQCNFEKRISAFNAKSKKKTMFVHRFFELVRDSFTVNRIETLKVCAPALIYVIQNNLYYFALQHIDATTFSVRTPFLLLIKIGMIVQFFFSLHINFAFLRLHAS